MTGERHDARGEPADSRERELPAVAVLLVNWRGWRDTVECLESVFRQEYPRFRVIVCDNDPRDESLDRIRAWAHGDLPVSATESHPSLPAATPTVPKPIATLVYDRAEAESGGLEGPDASAPLVLVRTGENLGFAGGNNVGLRYILARGDAEYVWLLNNDTVVDPRALRHMVELAESRPEAGMVGSKLLHYDRRTTFQLVGGGSVVPWRGLTTYLGEDELDAGQWDRPLELDYIAGTCLLARRETIAQVGLLDERYFLYSEEVDWCLRARRRGWTLLYSPGSRVWHKGGRSVGHGSPLHDYYAVRSMLLFVRKFYPRLLPVTFAYSLFKCLAPKLLRLQGARLRAVLRAYRDFLRAGLRSDPSGPQETARLPGPLSCHESAPASERLTRP